MYLTETADSRVSCPLYGEERTEMEPPPNVKIAQRDGKGSPLIGRWRVSKLVQNNTVVKEMTAEGRFESYMEHIATKTDEERIWELGEILTRVALTRTEEQHDADSRDILHWYGNQTNPDFADLTHDLCRRAGVPLPNRDD